MYTVMLGDLPPKRYDTAEEAWNCHYLIPRRGCKCKKQPCSCFERFCSLLEREGALQYHAAIVYKGEELPKRRYHVNYKIYVEK